MVSESEEVSVINKNIIQNIYHNDPEYKEKVKQQALARYYRLKELKTNTSISV